MILTKDKNNALWFKLTEHTKPRRVCTVKEACAVLKRTRRQVYRQINNGTIESAGKMLDEWLLDLESVQRLAHHPLSPQPIPKRLQSLLPEYDISKLNAGKDKIILISRILENGNKEDLRWLMRRYLSVELTAFLQDDGARLLSPRALRLWSLYFQVKIHPMPSWRSPNPWQQASA